MKKIFLLIFIVFSIQFVYSQSGWFWQNPLPEGNWLFDLKMFDANTGICVNNDNILITKNGGLNWKIFYTGSANRIMASNFINANTGYVFLNDSRLIKTKNAASNWSFVYQFDSINPRQIYFVNNNLGFLLCSSPDNYYFNFGTRLFRTSNGGQNWNLVISDTGFTLKSIVFTSPSTGYAWGNQEIAHDFIYHIKLFKSSDSGINWDTIANDFSPHNGNVLPIYFLNNNTGFFIAQNITHESLYKTSNGGTNWNILVDNFNYGDVKMTFLDENRGIVLGYRTLAETTDGGFNWVSRNIVSESYNSMSDFSAIDMSRIIVAGQGGLLTLTTNSGLNWVHISNDIDYWINDVRFSDVNTGFACGDRGNLFLTTNGGAEWKHIMLNDNIYHGDLYRIANIGNNIWYITQWWDGTVYKTTNTGLTWDTLHANLYGITRLKFLNENTGFGICKYDAFLKTSDGGLNWIVYDNLISQNWGMDFINENTGFVGNQKIYKTINGGANWDTTTISYLSYINDIQFVNNLTGYVAGYPRMFNGAELIKTTDGGKSWTGLNVSGYQLYDLFMADEKNGYAFDGNWYKTSDGGNNWKYFPICNYNYSSVTYFANPLTGWIVGDRGTIIKTTTGGESPVLPPLPPIIPIKFVLYQNYPNPFNPITHIKFDLPEAANVKLTIYDIIGRRVAVIVDAQLQPDYYEYTWDGKNFSSGVYFYQLKAGDFIQSKKMVLVK